jgi:AAA15 family ATPase/GTPase
VRLEFFTTHNTGCIDRLISQAKDDWGVDDLEVIARQADLLAANRARLP